MGASIPSASMSAAAYLEWERRQDQKHEFHAGEVFAMAGGSPKHNFLSSAIQGELRAAHRRGPRQVLSSDQRIVAGPGERYLYPDAVVVCGGFVADPSASDVLANPAIVVEVLSPSTEAYDRGLKWQAYRAIPSLTDYLLLSQGSARIEHYQREEGGAWRYRALEAGEKVILSTGAEIEVDAVYEGAFSFDAAS